MEENKFASAIGWLMSIVFLIGCNLILFDGIFYILVCLSFSSILVAGMFILDKNSNTLTKSFIGNLLIASFVTPLFLYVVYWFAEKTGLKRLILREIEKQLHFGSSLSLLCGICILILLPSLARYIFLLTENFRNRTSDLATEKPYISTIALFSEKTENSLQYVYLMRTDTGFYKIGRAKDPDIRQKQLERSYKVKFEIVHLIPTQNSVSLERELHRHFSGQRIYGELFNLSEEDVLMFIYTANYYI